MSHHSPFDGPDQGLCPVCRDTMGHHARGGATPRTRPSTQPPRFVIAVLSLPARSSKFSDEPYSHISARRSSRDTIVNAPWVLAVLQVGDRPYSGSFSSCGQFVVVNDVDGFDQAGCLVGVAA